VTSARSEGLLVAVYVREIAVGTSTSTEDKQAAAILRRYQPAVLENFSPRAVFGEGNCCYRAASLALYGDQKHHLHVRLLAAVEMLQFREHYDVSCRSYLGEPEMDSISGTYEQLVEAATTPSSSAGYAELMHIYANSAAFDVVISSVMPAIGVTSSPYTRTVFGRAVRRTASPAFTLMWSMAGSHDKSSNFVPQREDIRPEPHSISDDSDNGGGDVTATAHDVTADGDTSTATSTMNSYRRLTAQRTTTTGE